MRYLIILAVIFAACSKPDCNTILITVNNTSAIDYDIGVRYNGGECGSAQWSDYEFHQLENATYTVYIMHKSPRVMIDKLEVTFDRKECQKEIIKFEL